MDAERQDTSQQLNAGHVFGPRYIAALGQRLGRTPYPLKSKVAIELGVSCSALLLKRVVGHRFQHSWEIFGFLLRYQARSQQSASVFLAVLNAKSAHPRIASSNSWSRLSVATNTS